MAKISGVDIRPGNILEYEGGIWKVAKTQHTQPGKGGAFMQVEMKNLIDGRKTNVRFRSADTVEKVRLDTKDFQFLYAEGDDLVFMDVETYDQINLPKGDADLEEVLLRRRQLETNYEASVSFGFRYRFGSVLNNVVNPRFGGIGNRDRF